MADQNDTSNEHDFFTLASMFDTLANAARTHAPQAFERSADQLDMTHVTLLRGVAYLSFLLGSVPEDQRAPMQHRLAMSTLSEVSALVARLAEHQNAVDIHRTLSADRATEAAVG